MRAQIPELHVLCSIGHAREVSWASNRPIVAAAHLSHCVPLVRFLLAGRVATAPVDSRQITVTKSTSPQVERNLVPCPAGELLDTLPPGVDEVVAISKVVGFLKVRLDFIVLCSSLGGTGVVMRC